MATRSCSAALKSNSPFIARRVIAAILSPTPAKQASSSNVSPSTMVLSMSASSNALRRPRDLVTIASMGFPSSAARNAT